MTDHPQRRFSPPWDIDDNGACFIVRDNNGQALSYVYYEQEPGRRTAAGLLKRDEARHIGRLPTVPICEAKQGQLLTA